MSIDIDMDEEIAPAAPVSAELAKKPGKAKAAKSKPGHPAWAKMIADAVKELNENGGSSIAAIKKFILAHNTVDKDKLTPHMRRGINAALSAGTLIQAKGHGLAGSFKLGDGKAAAKPAPAKASEKKTAEKKKTSPKKAAPAKAKKIAVKKVAEKKAVTATPKKATEKPAAPKKTADKPKKSVKPVSPKPTRAIMTATVISPPKPKEAKAPKATKAPKASKAPKPKTTKKAKVTGKPKAKIAATK